MIATMVQIANRMPITEPMIPTKKNASKNAIQKTTMEAIAIIQIVAPMIITPPIKPKIKCQPMTTARINKITKNRINGIIFHL